MGSAKEEATNDVDSIRDQKARFRREARDRLRALAPEEARQRGLAAARRLAGLEVYRRAGCVGLFVPTASEPDIAGLLTAARDAGLRIALPAFDQVTGMYRFAWWAPKGALQPGPDGIPEPAGLDWADTAALDCVVVPGVAFDRAGTRLGHGGGHYDRLLARRPARVLGLAREVQLFDRLPRDSNDVWMDVVVTEDAVYCGEPVRGLSGGAKS